MDARLCSEVSGKTMSLNSQGSFCTPPTAVRRPPERPVPSSPPPQSNQNMASLSLKVAELEQLRRDLPPTQTRTPGLKLGDHPESTVLGSPIQVCGPKCP